MNLAADKFQPHKNVDDINRLADQCVKCGLCLPHCPTYTLFHNEAESPRGRIALAQAIANQELTPDKTSLAALSSCLQCRNCENKCPSLVKYGKLIDLSWQDINQQCQNRPGWLLKLMGSNRKLKWFNRLIYWYQRSGLQKLMRITGMLRLAGIKHYDQHLPTITNKQLPEKLVPQLSSKGRIGLFTGCLGRYWEHDALHATAQLLLHLGYEVIIPEDQNCCGALHQHRGFIEEGMQLATNNIDVFSAHNVDAVLYISSGCGAHIKEYPQEMSSFRDKAYA